MTTDPADLCPFCRENERAGMTCRPCWKVVPQRIKDEMRMTQPGTPERRSLVTEAATFLRGHFAGTEAAK